MSEEQRTRGAAIARIVNGMDDRQQNVLSAIALGMSLQREIERNAGAPSQAQATAPPAGELRRGG